jgi:hypothetical protein
MSIISLAFDFSSTRAEGSGTGACPRGKHLSGVSDGVLDRHSVHLGGQWVFNTCLLLEKRVTLQRRGDMWSSHSGRVALGKRSEQRAWRSSFLPTSRRPGRGRQEHQLMGKRSNVVVKQKVASTVVLNVAGDMTPMVSLVFSFHLLWKTKIAFEETQE